MSLLLPRWSELAVSLKEARAEGFRIAINLAVERKDIIAYNAAMDMALAEGFQVWLPKETKEMMPK